MPRAAPIQQDFGAGEITPLIQGQVQTDRYKKGLALCRNWIPTLQGALVRRPGTAFAAEVKTSSKAVRLVPFELSQSSGVVIEFGDQYIRFYYQEAQVLSGGVPYEVATNYLLADIPNLQFAQSGITLYVVHPNHIPAILTYTSLTSWAFANLPYSDGPYYDQQFSDPYTFNAGVTLSLSATTGTPFVNASANVFVAGDVGRLIRFVSGGALQGVLTIIQFNSATQVKAQVLASPTAGTASGLWRMGVWNAGNYPSCLAFHENRLCTAGVPSIPFRVDMSETGNFASYSPSRPLDGVVVDTNAVAVPILSNTLDNILWLKSSQKGLIVGAASNEFVIDSGQGNAAITPTSVAARRHSSHGSSSTAPVSVGRATIFVQRSLRKIREMVYFFAVDGFEAEDLTLESEHITTSGIKELAFQRAPYPIIWAVRNDGILIGATYQRTVTGMQVAWHQHVIGGSVGTGGDHAVVENIVCIPTSSAAPGGTGVQDELWMVVRRTINGTTRRYVEYMQPPFQLSNYALPNLAWYVDCGLTRADGFTITTAAAANPLTVTLNSVSGLTVGDQVTIDGVYGMGEINGKLFQILNISSLTVRLGDLNGNAIDGSSYALFAPGPPGAVAPLLFKKVSSISGLTYLEGQPVAMLGDGAPQTGTVASGAVAVSPSTGFLVVGLPYTSDAQLLRFEAGGADGTSMGKTRRNNRLGLMVYEAGNVRVGNDDFNQEMLVPRPATAIAALGQPLYSGIFSILPKSDFNFDNQILISVDEPLPATILAVMPMMDTQDRA